MNHPEQEELDRALATSGRGQRITQWLATRIEPPPDVPPPDVPPPGAAAGEEVRFVFPPYNGFLPDHVTEGHGHGVGGGYVFNWNGNGKVWAESPDQHGTSWGLGYLWTQIIPPLAISTGLSVRPLMSYEATWSIDQAGVTPAKVYGSVSLGVRSYDSGNDARLETEAFQELFSPPEDQSGSGDPSGYALQASDISIPSFEVNPQRQYAAYINVSVYARGQWQGEYDYARCDAAVSFGVRWLVLGQQYG